MWKHRCQNSFSISVHEEKTKDWSRDKLSMDGSWKVSEIRIAWLLVSCSCWCHSSFCRTCQAGLRVGNILVRLPGRSSNWYSEFSWWTKKKSPQQTRDLSSPSKAHHQEKDQNNPQHLESRKMRKCRPPTLANQSFQLREAWLGPAQNAHLTISNSEWLVRSDIIPIRQKKQLFRQKHFNMRPQQTIVL